MEQTFLGYVGTDLRFWASSVTAILRSIAVPVAAFSALTLLTFGAPALLYVAVAAVLFAFADWGLLVVRMARRIALRLEDPNALLDRTVLGNASYLYNSYYSGPMPSLNAVRG